MASYFPTISNGFGYLNSNLFSTDTKFIETVHGFLKDFHILRCS